MWKNEKKKLSVFYDGINALKSSKKFERVLMFCLKVGNYINSENKLKSQAFGFELKSLKQFADFGKGKSLKINKASEKNPTLLEYIYRQLRQNDSRLLEWTDELECLKDLENGKVILDSAREKTNHMKQTLGELKTRLKNNNTDSNNNNNNNSKRVNENEKIFCKEMNAFYQVSIKIFEKFESEQEELMTKLQDLSEYFAMSNSNNSNNDDHKTKNQSEEKEEKEKTIGIDCSYFSIINKFREDFIQVGDEIEKQETEQQKKQKPKQKQKHPVTRQKSLRSRHQPVMSELMEILRD